MNYFLESPDVKYQEGYTPEHTYAFTGPCVVTGKPQSVTVKGPDLYRFHRGAHIQDAFPELKAGDREWLKSGISDEGWRRKFGDPGCDDLE